MPGRPTLGRPAKNMPEEVMARPPQSYNMLQQLRLEDRDQWLPSFVVAKPFGWHSFEHDAPVTDSKLLAKAWAPACRSRDSYCHCVGPSGEHFTLSKENIVTHPNLSKTHPKLIQNLKMRVFNVWLNNHGGHGESHGRSNDDQHG